MDAEALGTKMVQAVGSYVRRALAPRDARIEALEARVKALEDRPALKYAGVWTPGETYYEGEFVSDHGSVWHCYERTTSRPGSSDAWQLAVKRGRDAR